MINYIIRDIFTLLCISLLLFWISTIIWWFKPYKAMTWFCHDIMHWHKPEYIQGFDGCNFYSHCRFCGAKILQDSQGEWFEVEDYE